jgi:YfiH family protein
MTVEVIRSALLDGLPHGFLGRKGGVSEGACAGLNVGLGSGDNSEAVAENRRRAVEALAPGRKLVSVYQTHSARAVQVDLPWSDDERPEADALVTSRPGLALAIVTADCTPVLLADLGAGVIGAAHAGWKGAVGGIVEATVAQMEALGARRESILAAVGPGIARKSYEVDSGFFRAFVERDPTFETFFSDGSAGRYQFDLEGFVLARLAASGIRQVEALGQDTYSQPDRFFSYRRATHRGEPDYGRQMSLIALP